MSERPQGHDPDVQLARLGQRCRSLAPTLYREQALYLQRVRSLLPSAVKTAIQNLLCTLPSDQTEALDEHQLQFQKRIDALLQRSSSLITVEQLLVLSARLKKEDRRLRMQQLQAFTERGSERADATELDDATSTPPAASVGVELSLDLPLERPDLIEGLLPVDPALMPSEPTSHSESLDLAASSSLDPGSEPSELDVLRSLFVMAGDSLESTEAESDRRPALDPQESNAVDPLDTNDQLMPETASGLLHWLDCLDAALIRRLRNLSHAVNVELMRAGINRSLLPIQLLDAVISGQLPSQSAPSNLLKLTLPLTLMTEEQSMQTLCVLVRPADLEFDDHGLRRIRARLRFQRGELGSWLLKERHWQRRARVREVQTHWWPNQPETPPSR
ncbi:hypothetical protein [Synechococcus sp. NOUM97013]|uniref:hypothetical protein n=1 Tax=Synechococcus sp. NOUM97013 TaxID=1442555 RepID=UPI001862F17F|nr:hypothetical protein [Synechococcus sp. NOUM97013]QNI73352.1 hypothetical protein SynNOUM97013_01288 [Synechococcus sp. NOUM97013]